MIELILAVASRTTTGTLLICPMVEIEKGFSGPLSCGSEISIQKTVFVRLIHLTSSIALLSVFVGTIPRSSLIEIF